MVPFFSPRISKVLAEIGDFSSLTGWGLETEPACAGTIRPSAASTGTPAKRGERRFMDKFLQWRTREKHGGKIDRDRPPSSQRLWRLSEQCPVRVFPST